MPSIGHKLTASYIFISLVTVIIMECLFFMAVYQYYVSGMSQTLVNHAEASAAMFNRYAPKGDMSAKSKFIYDNMKIDEAALVEIFDTNSHFVINNIGDTSHHIALTEDYEKALKGTTSVWRGHIDTGESIISVSAPLIDRDKVVGVVRYISSTSGANAMLRSNVILAVIIGLIIVVFAALLGYMMSARILIPVRDLMRVTREITKGNLKARANVYYDDEFGQLAETMNVMTEEIQRSDQAKSDFISSVSHELRTPLTSIKGWAETMEDPLTDSETAKLGMAIIERETNRLIHLVNDLLDFSQIQSGRIHLHKETMWIDGFLEEIYNQFVDRAKRENVTLKFKLDSEDAMIFGDENRLCQVIINIVDNAFKFVSGRTRPQITIQSHTLDAHVVITVEDNGLGMSSADLAHVKEKFYKGKSKRSGTGIGLSVANEIVELHDGMLYIDSIRGIGTKVSVVLPFSTKEHTNY